MIVRPYTEDDRDKVLDLCDEFWTKNFGAQYPYNRAHTSDKLSVFLSSGACIVADDISGLILLSVCSLPCNPAPAAADVMWYVKPNARGCLGKSLLEAAIRYCEVAGIGTLSMAHMQSSNPETIAKIYDKMGFVLKETTYVRAI